jgi:hypothetical protein
MRIARMRTLWAFQNFCVQESKSKPDPSKFEACGTATFIRALN